MGDERPEVTVLQNIPIPMRDGIRLYADVYLPSACGRVLSGRFPSLVERTPYGRHKADLCRTAEFFALRGYAVLLQDTRGRFGSEGVHVSYKSEPEDGYDTIEWVAAQNWSNGLVGTMGLSYGAVIQGATGALAPPHLRSMIPAMGFTDVVKVRKRHGGAARLSTLVREFRMVIDSPEALSNPSLRAYLLEAERNLDQWLKALPLKKGHNPFSLVPAYEEDVFDFMQKSEWHPDNIHPAFDVTPYYDRFSSADVLLIGGWYDSHSLATVEAFFRLRQRGKQRVNLIMGPWKHGAENLQVSYAGDVDFGPDSALAYDETRLRWFDQTLKAKAAPAQPPIHLFVMGGGSGKKTASGRLDHGGQWRYESSWPVENTRIVPLYLHANGLLSRQIAFDGVPTEYLFDPKNPVPTIGGPMSAAEEVLPAGGFDQKCRPGLFGASGDLPLAARHDVCVFQTEPLSRDIEVTGPLQVVLYASSDCPDTDFTAKLVDVYPPNSDYPAGYALNIQDGIMRARYRNRREPGDLLEPGAVYELNITLFPTSNLFKKGHRIRLDISSSNFPRFDVNPNTGKPLWSDGLVRVATNRIYHDDRRPSRLMLPVVERNGSVL